jgi:hypothetical protein
MLDSLPLWLRIHKPLTAATTTGYKGHRTKTRAEDIHAGPGLIKNDWRAKR